MPDRADAHIHLFEGGSQESFTGRPGVQIDEVACYASLAADHDVLAALVVGYAGQPWCATHNAYLARLAAEHDWVRPTAYVDRADELTVAQLEQDAGRGFVGVTFYVFDDEKVAAVAGTADEIWAWLAERQRLVSVNSKGNLISTWKQVLKRHPALHVLISHAGLPEPVTAPPSSEEAHRELAPVLRLAEFPGCRVKVSGFYAMTEPEYDYPHEAAWPFVETLLAAFGPERLLWASDFTPCLDRVTFPQTFGLFKKMPFLDDRMRRLIEGANLLEMLERVER